MEAGDLPSGSALLIAHHADVTFGNVAVVPVTTACAKEQAGAPSKFIPAFAVKYGGTTGWPPADEAARFDLIAVSAGTAHARVHASAEGNTWQTLKNLNPNMKFFLYKNGPALYNTSSWGWLGP